MCVMRDESDISAGIDQTYGVFKSLYSYEFAEELHLKA